MAEGRTKILQCQALGKLLLVTTKESSTQLLRTSLDLGPATDTPAHCSETLVTLTLRSVHLV